MITELLLTGLFGVADILLTLLPEFSFSFNTSAWSYAADALSMVAYLLPWDTVCTIAGVIISIAVLRVTLALILTILRFIPLVG